MNLEKIVIPIYIGILLITLIITSLQAIVDDNPEEIKDFYSWLFYGLLWPLIWIRELLKFLINFFKH